MKKVKEEVPTVQEKEVKTEEKSLTMTVQDVNQFISIMDVILVGDDRLKPLRTHFVEILKRNNENNKEQ